MVVMSMPEMWMLPVLISSMWRRVLMKEDLPLPLRPHTPSLVPDGMIREICCNAMFSVRLEGVEYEAEISLKAMEPVPRIGCRSKVSALPAIGSRCMLLSNNMTLDIAPKAVSVLDHSTTTRRVYVAKDMMFKSATPTDPVESLSLSAMASPTTKIVIPAVVRSRTKLSHLCTMRRR